MVVQSPSLRAEERSLSKQSIQSATSDASQNRALITAKMFLVILLPISALIFITIITMVNSLKIYGHTKTEY